MSLTEYKKKRKFDETSEPAGKVEKHRGQLHFVVQKHDASHLHYDFRLEMEGVLKSWAVPKGPSLNPEDKRLAMMVEDHPYSYRNFEGTISKGNYGAGEVIVWDNGTYGPADDNGDAEKTLLAQLKKGHLDIVLHGHKLNGRFALVKTNKMEENGWLLIKKHDKYASTEDVTRLGNSVLSDKSLDVEGPDLSSAPETKLPTNVKPMLATLVAEPFDDSDWLYEIKWDGYRAIASWDGQTAELYSRNGKNFAEKFSEVHEALRDINHKVVLDGEVVAVDDEGKAHFDWLQNYGHDHKGNLVYYVFDILWLDDHDLTGLPLIERKKFLRHALDDSSRLRYSDHIVGKGKQFFNMAARQELEGIIAKNCGSVYRQGFRSKQWLKIKTHKRQEVVIGGFTEPKGSRKHIGALLVGVNEAGQLRYVGHVGGGIPPKEIAGLRQKLDSLERQSSPFANKFKPNGVAHWVEPKLLAEVSFAEWTSDGHLRQPIFVGLRTDKPAAKVVREEPIEVPSKTNESKNTDRRVKFTHPDKVFWPEKGYTKQDLLDYYLSVSDVMLPYLRQRPESMLRHPNGYNGKSFFQKDAIETVPDWAETVKIHSESLAKDIHYLICNNTEDLELMVQLGCIEINPWSSRLGSLDKPDWVVLDLDPEDIEFSQVIKVAQVAKQICDELKIPCYPKTSGKTGIHIFIPTGAQYSYDQIKTFGQILATMVNDRTPDITSLLRSPSKRQHKIYVDFLQNREGQTLAAPYSVRPTPTASVSTPLHWDEVKAGLDPAKFTIKTTSTRLKRVGDPWQPVLGKGIDLSKILSDIGMN